MSLVPEQTVAAVREATDIVALIGEYVRDLKPSGKDFKALCPFHDEKTPSFYVVPQKGIFMCFGCQAKGNVFSFLMQMEKIPFSDALRRLAERAGISIQTFKGEDSGRREQLYKAHEWVAAFFRSQLLDSSGRNAREYIASRGISQEFSEQFLLGFSPDSWDILSTAAQSQGITEDLLVELGVLGRKDGRTYARFRNRLMFPVFDAQSRVVGFGARTLGNDEPKYLNTSETALFHKSEHLYGLQRAAKALRRDGTLVLVEGYTDVIMAHQHGFDNVVAALGTAINDEHVRLIRRWSERVVLTLDGDKPGQDSAARSLRVFLKGDIEVRLALMPGGKDPCDLLTQDGPEPFRMALATSLDPVEFAYRRIDDQKNPDRVHSFVKAMTALFGLMPSQARRELYLKRLTDITGLQVSTLKSLVKEEVPIQRPKVAPMGASNDPPSDELGVLAALIQDPSNTPEFVAALGDITFDHPLVREMVSRVIGHLAGAPSSSTFVAEGLFQSMEEITLLASCHLLGGGEAKVLFRDCLARLKRRRIRVLDTMAREARERSDEMAYRALMDTRYRLSQDLSGALRRTS